LDYPRKKCGDRGPGNSQQQVATVRNNRLRRGIPFFCGRIDGAFTGLQTDKARHFSP